MKKIRNLVLFFVMIMILSGINVCAATVSDKLEQPEEGWRRYDDSNNLIKKSSGWIFATETNPPMYNGTLTKTNTSGEQISFKFKGTKLRIISTISNIDGTSIPITIDGDNETYNTNNGRPLNESYSAQQQILVYQKLDLDDSIHEVVIGVQEGYWSNIDAIDIDADGELLSIDTPNIPLNLIATASDSSILLNWDEVDGADSYTILRSTKSDSINTVITSNVTGTTYIDNDVETGVPYYYVVRAVKDGVESPDSNVAVAMIEKINSAVLQIKLSTTDIYEYRVTMNEVDNFMNWYINRSNDIGLPFYKFTTEPKIDPYINSNEYLIFDKIVWFKVKEYLQ